MGRYSGSRPAAAPKKGGGSLWTGILVGTVIGAGLAAGVAWYLTRSKPFLSSPPVAKAPAPVPEAAPVGPGVPADGKPRFEFYNVLTDKPGATAPARTAEKPKADKPKAADGKPAIAYDPQILQAGSFAGAADAEKLKAKLALLGLEAHVQSADVPGKGVRHRVRLGPYKSEGDLSRTRDFLKQNGIDSTPMRAQ